jgi:chromate reductase
MSLPTFLTVSGSLRAESFNTVILERFAQFANGKAEVVHSHYLGELPLYNQDLDNDKPPAVVAVARAEIAASDFVVVATPEYNYGIPGPLKNWFDWMSRPYGAHVFLGKKVFVIGSAPSPRGGKNAVEYLRLGFTAIQAVVVGDEVLLPNVHETLNAAKSGEDTTLTTVFQHILQSCQ